jgi:hypothetical protein
VNGTPDFDRQVRAALEWQADERARRAPTLSESARHVAERLGPQPTRIVPVIVARSGTGRSIQLVFVVALLLAVVAIAIAIGSQVLRTLPVPFEPVPFGFGGPCDAPPDDELVYTVVDEDSPTTLYGDGRLVRAPLNPGDTRSAIFEGQDTFERRLSPLGIERIRERIEATELAGCRYLRAASTSGQITVHGPDGVATLYWHPSNGSGQFLRQATPEEEAAAADLYAALEHPETWLPADAWIDDVEQRVRPERWYVIVELSDSGLRPGDVYTTSTGLVLDGADPRYRRVVMPGGVEPAEFGMEIPAIGGAPRARCGVVTTADAQALAASLDALPLAMHDEEQLFTEDMTTSVFIYVVAATPNEPDCALFAEQRGVGGEPTATPRPSSHPEDDLAAIDPCSLVPAAVDGMLEAETRETRDATVTIGKPARSCVLLALPPPPAFPVPARLAAVTLYPRTVDEASAAALALSVLGGTPIAETIAGRPVWLNTCLAAAQPCGAAAVAWADGRLLVFELDPPPSDDPSEPMSAGSPVPIELARGVLDATLASLDDAR